MGEEYEEVEEDEEYQDFLNTPCVLNTLHHPAFGVYPISWSREVEKLLIFKKLCRMALLNYFHGKKNC